MKSGHLFPYPAIALARFVSDYLKDKKTNYKIKLHQTQPKRQKQKTIKSNCTKS
jgi:hypothetical protein